MQNVLIIDDDRTTLAFLEKHVRKMGVVARAVDRVEKAISAVKEMLPDLIILDVTMPGTDGFEYCSMLKEDARTADIPVIFISALNVRSEKIRGFNLGAVDFITKPFDLDEITFRINTQLVQSRKNRELAENNRKYHEIMAGQMDVFLEEYKHTVMAMTILLKDVMRDDEKESLTMLGENARKLALSLQLLPEYEGEISNDFVNIIGAVAVLHDIGKLYISQDIIKKQGMLTPEETETLKKHTLYGAEKLDEIKKLYNKNEYLEMAEEIALYHHENWDGTGYPEGLSGKSIPLSARIIRIVNSFGSRTGAYRREGIEESREKVFEEMSCEGGTLFDPDILKIFLKIKRQIKSLE